MNPWDTLGYLVKTNTNLLKEYFKGFLAGKESDCIAISTCAHRTGQQDQLAVSKMRILIAFSVSNLAYLLMSSTYDSSCTFLFFELSKLYERTGKGCLLRLPKSTSLVREVFISRQLKLLLGLCYRVVFLMDMYCVFKKKKKKEEGSNSFPLTVIFR